MLNRTWFKDAEATLIELAGTILQTNKGASRKLLDLLVAKGAGAAGVGGVVSLVTALGTATTGTAISTLTGAAATTAKLYWVGSLVGGGVLAGTGILAVGGIAVGYAATRFWRGKTRPVETLSEEEKSILSAVELLIPAFKVEMEKTGPLTEVEISAIWEVWTDLTATVDTYVKIDSKENLAPKSRIRIRRCYKAMTILTKEIQA